MVSFTIDSVHFTLLSAQETSFHKSLKETPFVAVPSFHRSMLMLYLFGKIYYCFVSQNV